jgi:Mor family transcriptional regulator
MGKRQNTQVVIERYLDRLEMEVIQRLTDSATIKDVAKHLIYKGMIDPKRIRYYMIIRDFDIMISEGGKKVESYIDLAVKYDLSEIQVQNIIYRHRDKELPINNIDFL